MELQPSERDLASATFNSLNLERVKEGFSEEVALAHTPKGGLRLTMWKCGWPSNAKLSSRSKDTGILLVSIRKEHSGVAHTPT